MKVNNIKLWLASVLALVLVVSISTFTEATLQKLLHRQSRSNENITTLETSTPSNLQQGLPNGGLVGVNQDSGRLYPTLHQPYDNGGLPAFNPQFPGGNSRPTPFIPFGLQLPNFTGFNDQRFNMAPQPRPMTTFQRIQSQTFTDGLGRRLLSMVGIGNPSNETETSTRNLPPVDAMRALQNSTVLEKLRNGLHSVYGNLSKMYNSTVQQQLNLIQERYQRETENSTNPWQQRVAQQVPMMLKSMAMKVGEAQENLNHLWHRVTHGTNSTERSGLVSAPTIEDHQARLFQPGGFFNQLGNSFGINADPNYGAQGIVNRDLGSPLMNFWHNQVQPQMHMVRSQIAHVWRDLTANGARIPMARFRSDLGSAQATNTSGVSDTVDDILKDVNIDGQEYKLIDPVADQQQPNSLLRTNINSQVQSGLTSMQRELNQVWNGLSHTLQNAMANVRNTLDTTRTRHFGPISTTTTNNDNKSEADSATNELNAKIMELSKVQKDADVVYDIVQQQQQRQAQQQRPSLFDRFRDFFAGMNLN